ncbi:MAG: hypothetical protein SOI44_02730 [Lactimicrobium sp.]|jgi:hypothetical protein|uniref:hypothetical protein n=1 Tax=Lactimicrobium sp. TaxID=2563780 RepID=UPI002F357736
MSSHGFALSDVLITILISVMLLPVVTACLWILPHLTAFDEGIQDEIALQQLRRILMLSYDLECQGDTLTFQYQGRDCQLVLRNNRMILQPGTQIFLNEIENMYFSQEQEAVYVYYQRESSLEKAALAYRAG